MDDNCAVCADTLEWVAYGACGHRDVCSTCVVRLRFICQDRRCCICKTESDVVFITKALGDYTTLIKDFSSLPSQVKEGRVASSSYWYHEDSQAFFDDSDHYKTIKAMCKPSCRECDVPIRSVSQLKTHLERQHKLFMCSQCLKGRNVFISEQKLYISIAQLNRHIASGDSKVDGSESERGGFRGHPMCQFCRTGFYGESELYTHMSTQHYTCHICQRQNPGKYEYYKNYDDLEMHFRRRHFLCEDQSCLAKKFVVFQSEAEMKRHSLEHEGPMPRSKRNAVLQIPTSFRYQHEPDHRLGRGGRGQTFLRESSENQVSTEIQESSETSNIGPSSSSGQVAANIGDISDTVDPIVDEFESLSTTDVEISNRYRQALQNSSGNAPFVESLFPSLVPGSSQSNPKNESYGLPNTITMAAHLRRQNNRNVATNAPAVQPANSAEAWPTMHASAHVRKLPSTSPTLPKVENHVQAANKALVEKIRAALEYDEEKYTTFKDISGQYRQGSVHTEVYLDFVQQFGLMHLVLDLAVLCPDTQKQRELIGAYNNIVRNNNGAQENGRSQSSARMKDTSSSKKGKGKISKAENNNSKKALADSIMSSVIGRRKC